MSKQTINIAGVNIERDHPTVKEAKDEAGLQKLGFFGHLGKEAEKEAMKQLWDELHPKKEEAAKV